MMQEAFRKRLHAQTRDNGWTVAELAVESGIPKRTLDKYLARNGSLPGFAAIRALSRALNVSCDWLVFGDDADILKIRGCH